MLDRDARLAPSQPEVSADLPAAREIRVESQGAVDQPHRRADIFAEMGQRISGICQDARIVASHFQSLSGELDTL
jgi:hypothetical protein